jgi:hypothetical protein
MIRLFLAAFVSLYLSMNSISEAFEARSFACRRLALRKSTALFPAISARSLALNVQAEVEKDSLFQRKNLPVLGVAIGLTALSFQLFVLYPWHETLRDDFSNLEVNIKQLNDATPS